MVPTSLLLTCLVRPTIPPAGGPRMDRRGFVTGLGAVALSERIIHERMSTSKEIRHEATESNCTVVHRIACERQLCGRADRRLDSARRCRRGDEDSRQRMECKETDPPPTRV